jgi:DNA-binding response OmpR family regulator
MARKRRLLIVDDDEEVRELLEQHFRDQFAVSLAADGADAIEIVLRDREGFDVVVVDLEMPRMDGATFVEELRHHGVCVPILIVSASPEAAGQAQRVRAQFLAKPFELPQLRGRVENLLSPKARRERTKDTADRAAKVKG